ncbi:polyketide synthase of type I [Desulfocucumis palustris]|uniref:Polyketide synthase of type I n=1 Tax=Desulfocucumis palustris TaxID=1898651 RepID=A0A2L2X8D2_9FIRM|nr:type I polyketide synthase [Desulfocucumis palustris]GBF32469.1 polyketide synthase of type I [Desulfocucumis palustris]
MKGLIFDWNKLYGGARPRRISLPTYPFAGERCWFSGVEAGAGSSTTGPAESIYDLTTEKVIITKDWQQKTIKGENAQQAGAVVVLGTVKTMKLAAALFEEIEAIKVVRVIHEGTLSSEEISTDFYSVPAGEYLHQQIKDKLNSQKLLGVIDVTPYDEVYEQSIAVESGKITFLQKLIEHDRNEGYKLLQVTHQLCPFQLVRTTMQGARLAGLYRMLGAEYKQIQAMTMDSDCSFEEYEKLAKQIQREFWNRNTENLTECCYRNGERYEPHLTISQTNDDIQKSLHILEQYEKHDVILITGGSRGIGASIARHVVSQGVKNIVLLGREDLPEPSEWKKILVNKEKPELEEKLKGMQSLIDQGVRVHYYNTSLMDQKGINAMVHKIHQYLGPITGVFHCAGLTSKNPAFFKKPLSDIEAVCEPKIKGLVTLHKALEKEPLNFFILFSSLSSIAPTLSAGQSDYAMANAYMDYYALHQTGEGKSYFKSIQWPAWGETGLAAGGARAPAYIRTGIISHTTADGLAFLDIIKRTPNIVSLPCVMAPGEFKCEQLLKTELISVKKEPGFRLQQTSRLKPKELSIQARADLRTSVVQWLQKVIGAELKLRIEQLDEDKPFDEYGVDSIILAQLTQTMQEMVSNTITPSLFLEYRTISTLADYFMSNYQEDLRKNIGLETDSVRDNYLKENNIPINNEPSQSVNPELRDNGKAVWVSQAVANNQPVQTLKDIAVVGISCRFPGAPTKEAYWSLLTEGTTAIKPLSEKRWSSKDNRVYYGGWVDDFDLFDPKFFNINENDASIMDPQARIILEESLKAIYDAGYEYKQLSGQKIGVFIGGRSQPNMNVNAILQAPNPILGIGQNYLAANISRFFNFKGPSLVLDTACSSGITGLLFAADSLREKRIDMALTGAVNILLSPYAHHMFAARNILSKNGEFHIFDKRSGGEVIGEGVGVVLLKRLGDAIKDGNHIYGVIKAISVNNDGRTLGPGSPDINAQKQVMQEALLLCGKQPEDIGYIEVNGGGSPVIDAIEIKALSETYHLTRQALTSCFIGSVKPNIGHLLLASGLAGFIRCVLSVYHKKIPPFLSAFDPFNYYDFSASRIHFNRETIDWKIGSGKKRIAAQNSFPDGGTNCHVLIEEFAPDGSYQQQYLPKTAPDMVKKRFTLSPLSFSESFPAYAVAEVPAENAETSMDKYKENFKKQPDWEIKQQEHVLLKNIWGEYHEKNI